MALENTYMIKGMIKKVQTYIEQNHFIEDGDMVFVGVSGGADSICLLCVLSELYRDKDIKLHAIHVNHQLRETALRDQRFAEEMCKRLEVPVTSIAISVEEYAKENGLSTEEAARKLRYRAFADVMEKYAEEVPGHKLKIAVAHNKNDNAETMLFNLFRGTGLKGLAGIPPKRNNIIRPLLCVGRDEIEMYLEELGVGYCTDETNLTDDYSRNRIRHHILPVAEIIHSGAVNQMNETAEGLQLAEDFIFCEVRKAKNQVLEIKDNGFLLYIEELQKHHPYIQQRVLLEILSEFVGTRKDIAKVHVEALLDLFTLQVGRTRNLPYACIAKRIYEGVLLYRKEPGDINGLALSAKDEELSETFIKTKLNIPGKTKIALDNRQVVFTCRIFSINSEQSIEIPKEKYTKWFDCDKMGDDVVIRTRQAGDYFTTNTQGGHKDLKSYFIDQKVPGDYRDNILLLAKENHIAWIIGHRTSFSYYVTEETKNILEISYQEYLTKAEE